MRSRLQTILQAKIRAYLTLDNPEPASLAQRFSLFVKGRGAEGRSRARDYSGHLELLGMPSWNGRTSILLSDFGLAYQVFKEICSSNSYLGTSNKLRDRLLEGLCLYYGYSLERIEGEMTRLVMRKVLSDDNRFDFSMGPEKLRRYIMEDIIRKEIAKNSSQSKLYADEDNKKYATPLLEEAEKQWTAPKR